MNTILVIIWAVLIAVSIGWYAFLVFYVGAKAGREIKTMIARLRDKAPPGP